MLSSGAGKFLKLAGSLAYGVMVYEAKRMTYAPPDALCLLFLRGAGRINDALRLSRVSGPWQRIG